MNAPDDSKAKTAKTLPRWLRWFLHNTYPGMSDAELIEKMEAAGVTRKDRYKLWFNRIDRVLSYPHFVLHWIVVIVAWNAVTGGDWFYRLLLSLSAGAMFGPVVALVLSPLAILFWLIDSRYPIRNRFLGWLLSLSFSALFLAIYACAAWFLVTRHVGNAGSLQEPLSTAFHLAGSSPDYPAIARNMGECALYPNGTYLKDPASGIVVRKGTQGIIRRDPPVPGSSAQVPIQVNSREECDKLPAGTWYRYPDGDILQKPPIVVTQQDWEAVPFGGSYWYQGKLLTKRTHSPGQ